MSASPSYRAHSLPPRIATIVSEVSEKHLLTPDELVGQGRRHHACVARWEAFTRVRDEIQIVGLPPSLTRIGQWFGGRDHTTVLHGLRRYEAMRETAA